MKYNIKNVTHSILNDLIPEMYEDEVYIWEIYSILRRIRADNPEVFPDINQIEYNNGFINKVIMAVVEHVVILPGVETYLTGWPLDGDWEPCRLTMPAEGIVETIRGLLDRLNREPVTLEIAFFRGVEANID